MQHVAGKANMVADALSRPPEVASIAAVEEQLAEVVMDLCGIAARQERCPSTQAAVQLLSLQVRACDVQGVRLLCDSSTGRLGPLVPKVDRLHMLRAIRGVAHPGVRAT